MLKRVLRTTLTYLRPSRPSSSPRSPSPSSPHPAHLASLPLLALPHPQHHHKHHHSIKMTKGTETHELSVEGDKVLERTESGTLVAEKVRVALASLVASRLLRVPARAGSYGTPVADPPPRTPPPHPLLLALPIPRAQDYDHVVRGYKAAEHNPRFTEETHKVRTLSRFAFPLSSAASAALTPPGPRRAARPQNAEHIRHDLEAAHDAQQHDQENNPHDTRHHHSDSHAHAKDKQHKGETHEDEVHRHRCVALALSSRSSCAACAGPDPSDDLVPLARSVVGGYKGTLHRDDRSEEAKEHAREKLRELGENTD